MLTRIIYPLKLREKISYRFQKIYPNPNDKNVGLEFNKKLRFDLSKNDVSHQSIIFNGFYELDLTRVMIRVAKNGGVLVDVGANYGYYSCLWAAQHPQNSVFAFEASPLNLQPLQHNVDKNGLGNQVKVIPLAMGKEKGKLSFDLVTEDKQTSWGGFTINESSNAIEVEVDTLDNYIAGQGIEVIDVLKIDTEGADTWVLYGAKNLLEQKRVKHIFFEHNPTRMKLLNIDINEAKDFLQGLGYIVEQQSFADFYAYPKKQP